MDESRQPGVEFEQIFVNRAHFSHRFPPGVRREQPATGDLQLEASISEREDRKAAILLVRLTTNPSDTKANYDIDVEMGAIARVSEGQENLPPAEYLQNLGVPMMFPFLREFIANLTMRGRSGPVWLKPVNLRALQSQAKEEASGPHTEAARTAKPPVPRKRKHTSA